MDSGGAYPGHRGWRPDGAVVAHHHGHAEAVAGITGLYYGHGGSVAAGHHQKYGSGDDQYSGGDHYPNDEEAERSADDEDDDTQIATGKPLNKQQQYYLELWDTRYAQLKKYKRRHGTCTVPEKTDQQLSSWAKKQRAQYRRGKLSQERKDRLDLLGFDFSHKRSDARWGKSPEEHFESRCQQLIAFRERHGHCKVPVVKTKDALSNNEHSNALGKWLQDQNYQHLRGKLSEERHARLEEIGVEFRTELVTKEEHWTRRYKAFVEYRKRHGNAGEPKWSAKKGERSSEDDSLAQWAQAQRDKHRKGKLEDARVRKLRAICFDFSGEKSSAWEARFRELVEYKKRYGEVRAPLRFECTKSLNEWACKQRKRFKEDRLTRSQISRLRKLGYSFIPIKEHGFDKMLEALRKYKDEHGNVDVPSDYKEDPCLARWVELQREKHSRDKISLNHHTSLEALGFKWEDPNPPEEESNSDTEGNSEEQAKEDAPVLRASLHGTKAEICNARWEERYQALVEFWNQHGHCTVGRAYDKTLCYWVRKQREAYRHNDLVKERYDKLCLLDFDFKGQERQTDSMQQNRAIFHAQQFEKRCKQLEEFQREHGHCHPKAYGATEKRRLESENGDEFPDDDELRLGKWIMSLNKKHKKGELEQKKLDRLTEIGWKPYHGTINRKDLMKWDEMFDCLAAYKREKGTCNVPHKYPQNKALGYWANSQMRRWSEGRMTEEQEERLRHLGFSFKPTGRRGSHSSRWEDRYNRLAAYRREHGHSHVPCSHEDQELSRWCSNQKQRYRKNKMKSDEEALLRRLGFEFPSRPAQELAATVATAPEGGPQRVTVTVTKPSRDVELGLGLVQKKGAAREAEGNLELVAIANPDPSWENRKRRKASPGTHSLADTAVDPEEAEWLNYFDRLKSYVEQHKTSRFDSPGDENQDLKVWAQKQRADMGKGTIMKHHFDLLSEINFFEPEVVKEKTKRAKTVAEAKARAQISAEEWRKMYQALIDFRIRFKHSRVPVVWQENLSLSRWVYEQRKKFEEGSLPVDDVRKLDALGLFFGLKNAKNKSTGKEAAPME